MKTYLREIRLCGINMRTAMVWLLFLCILFCSQTAYAVGQSNIEINETDSTLQQENETSEDMSTDGTSDSLLDKVSDEDSDEESVIIYGPDVYNIEQTFSTDYHLSGLMSTVVEYFIVEDWDIVDANVNIVVSTTQLVQENLSDITLSVNSTRFYTENTPVTDGTKREIKVAIPMEYIKEGINTITIESYIRTEDGQPCVDDVTAANWINIFKESSVVLNYKNRAANEDIGSFYKNFVSVHSLYQNDSAVVLNPNYDEGELAGALNVMAGVSSNSVKYYDSILLATYMDERDYENYANVIYVAKVDNLPSYIKNEIVGGLSLQKGEGAILFLKGQSDHLVVTAVDDAGLDKASKALMNGILMKQIVTSHIDIGEKTNVDTSDIKTEDITYFAPNGQYIDGPFRQKATFYPYSPVNRMLTVGSEVDLKFRYSENLDFNRSLVTIYVDDVPIASKKLSAVKVNGDRLIAQIPADLNVTGPVELTISFDLEIEDLWCTLRQPDTPWAYILDSSYMNLVYTDVAYFLFEYYPTPFISEGGFYDLAVVVPDENNKIQLEHLGGLMNVLGRSINSNRGNISVLKASNANSETLKDKNIILYGTFNDNNAIKDINEDLFFKFYQDGNNILSNEKINLGAVNQKTLGTVQILDSPYSDTKKGLLVFSGVSYDGLDNAANYIAKEQGLLGVYGDGFICDDDTIYSFGFKEDNYKEPSIISKAKERKDVTILVLLVILILILIATIIVFLWVKYNKKGKHSYEAKK